ncbi:Oligopeptide transporter 5 [Acorus calamus]|uniref:Oligopeptide transporter 5 n=1 Tax=Acorus calamus TaxID=4465 RepID=A0AAV9CSJ4_ACOCL|nr:Oligopeptide transporter 5 [Acorus calamus]
MTHVALFEGRRYKGWWAKYNYVMSNALDAGCAFMALVVTCALQSFNVYDINWWGLDVDDHCPLATCPTDPGVVVDVMAATRVCYLKVFFLIVTLFGAPLVSPMMETDHTSNPTSEASPPIAADLPTAAVLESLKQIGIPEHLFSSWPTSKGSEFWGLSFGNKKLFQNQHFYRENVWEDTIHFLADWGHGLAGAVQLSGQAFQIDRAEFSLQGMVGKATFVLARGLG